MNDYRLYLQHSGVEGQKWGVKNGPPYPLDKTISNGSRLRSDEERKRMQAKEARQREKAARKVARKQEKADRKLRNKYRNTLTDEELDIYISRLEKERRLDQLTNMSYNRGKNATMSVIGKIGQDTFVKLAETAIAGLGAMAIYQCLGGKADAQMWAEQLSGIRNKNADKGNNEGKKH